jgi:hypothetical protein
MVKTRSDRGVSRRSSFHVARLIQWVCMQQIEKQSVQSLLLEALFGTTVLSTATGFVVVGKSGPLLITNRHVVTGRHQDTNLPISSHGGVPDRLRIWHNALSLGDWVAVEEDLYVDGHPRWYEHPSLQGKMDVVALPLKAVSGTQLYPYDLHNPGDDLLVGPSAPVSVIGFPFGLTGGGKFAIWATGSMAIEPSADYSNLPVSLIDCRSRQGQSGSPVIAFRRGGASFVNGSTSLGGTFSRLLGVYSGRINKESDLGMVWKVSAVADLVDSIQK